MGARAGWIVLDASFGRECSLCKHFDSNLDYDECFFGKEKGRGGEFVFWTEKKNRFSEFVFQFCPLWSIRFSFE